MSPREALNILDEASSQLTANRQVHSQIVQAINTLNGLVIKDDAARQEVAQTIEKAAKKVVDTKDKSTEK